MAKRSDYQHFFEIVMKKIDPLDVTSCCKQGRIHTSKSCMCPPIRTNHVCVPQSNAFTIIFISKMISALHKALSHAHICVLCVSDSVIEQKYCCIQGVGTATLSRSSLCLPINTCSLSSTIEQCYCHGMNLSLNSPISVCRNSSFFFLQSKADQVGDPFTVQIF